MIFCQKLFKNKNVRIKNQETNPIVIYIYIRAFMYFRLNQEWMKSQKRWMSWFNFSYKPKNRTPHLTPIMQFWFSPSKEHTQSLEKQHQIEDPLVHGTKTNMKKFLKYLNKKRGNEINLGEKNERVIFQQRIWMMLKGTHQGKGSIKTEGSQKGRSN